MSRPGKPINIIITGASRGIGAALALDYAEPDVHLGLIGRNAEHLADTAEQCRRKGASVSTGQLDITDTLRLTEWIQAFDAESPVNLLIANAGITSQIGQQGEAEPIETIRRLMDTNLYGVIHSIDAILPAMRKRGVGQIALVSSLAAYRAMPVTPTYSASKAAVKSYGEALRGWLSPEGIRINIICPGFVTSDMSNSFTAPKPFMITAEKAARIIKTGLTKNRAIIAFPFPLNLGMWLLSILPFSLASFFLGLSGYNRNR